MTDNRHVGFKSAPDSASHICPFRSRIIARISLLCKSPLSTNNVYRLPDLQSVYPGSKTNIPSLEPTHIHPLLSSHNVRVSRCPLVRVKKWRNSYFPSCVGTARFKPPPNVPIHTTFTVFQHTKRHYPTKATYHSIYHIDILHLQSIRLHHG